MDWQKQFEEWFDKQDDNSELSFDTKSFMACYKAARKATLEEVLEMSVYSSYVDAIDIEDIKKKLKELE